MFFSRIMLRSFTPFRLAAALAVIGPGLDLQAADYIYAALSNDTIVRYDVSLPTSALVQASETVFLTAAQGLYYSAGLALDKAGNLYVGNANTITRYDSSGNQLEP